MEGQSGNPTKVGGLSLEEIVHIANKVGLDFAEAKQKAEHLALMKASTRAAVMLRIENNGSEKYSESKLQRLAETDPEYLEFLTSLSDAKKESERLKVRYESYKNLFEAKRSMMSLQKAEMSLL